jgi:putative membrane protein
MPSDERRLHPYTILFAFLTQIRALVVPGLLVAFGVSSRGDGWHPWMMLLIIPTAVVAVIRYISYSYRYDERELVIRSGLLFRRERHIPYARIQNVDAVQNVLHRLLGVVEVRLDTGSGGSAEATMSVLPVRALEEMRERVFAGRQLEREAAERPRPWLALTPREVMLSGFIDSRGGVLIAAAFGVMWELQLFERFFSPGLAPAANRSVIRNAVRGVMSNAAAAWQGLAVAVALLAALLIFVRILSMIWALIRLHGFTLTLQQDEARAEYGLLTHVSATVPLRRVQMLTVRERPLHRLFRRVAVRVETAGGHEAGAEGAAQTREDLAPILQKTALGEFVRTLTGVDLSTLAWQPPHPRAFGRELRRRLVFAAAVAVALAALARWYSIVPIVILLLWTVLAAHRTIRHLRWCRTDDAVLLQQGWMTRTLVIVPLSKMQVVTRHESPFDRRTGMASVHVDTAAASGNPLHIVYLPEDTAHALHEQLSAAAATTAFRW